MENNAFKQTVILVDADYTDDVAFDLTVNFERMLMRRIPKADLAQWLICVSLDGGVVEGENEVQAVFLYGPDREEAKCLAPGKYSEIDGHAFKDERMGEFLMSTVRREGLAGGDFFVECAEAVLNSEGVRTVVLVPDMEKYGAGLKALLTRNVRKKDVTLLSMQPETGRGFQNEILGYSLMHAMGIRGEEIEQIR